MSRARDEAAQWRQLYKAPIPAASLADRMGSYAQAYTLYSSVRPFGVTAIIGAWDAEAELPVDGQVGSGPKTGSGGKKEGATHGGPSLYMIEPSGLYWVCTRLVEMQSNHTDHWHRAITGQQRARDDRLPSRSSRSSTSPRDSSRSRKVSRRRRASSMSLTMTTRTRSLSWK